MYGGSPYVQVGTTRRVWSISTLHVGPDKPDPRPNPKPNPNPNPNPNPLAGLEVGTRSAGGLHRYCILRANLTNLARTCDYTRGVIRDVLVCKGPQIPNALRGPLKSGNLLLRNTNYFFVLTPPV